jgi:hypothetical protein
MPFIYSGPASVAPGAPGDESCARSFACMHVSNAPGMCSAEGAPNMNISPSLLSWTLALVNTGAGAYELMNVRGTGTCLLR